ncbi:Hypothetical predicted protein [Octopus vulgaris]|uniref:Uncharacterized protein n=1 Tax=Octopus vulgaris TaxID=6645 RepID=A0AA36EWX9_OCTVU|nr:Hypothetical predicted protein [Octopus vulgaris]
MSVSHAALKDMKKYHSTHDGKRYGQIVQDYEGFSVKDIQQLAVNNAVNLAKTHSKTFMKTQSEIYQNEDIAGKSQQ